MWSRVGHRSSRRVGDIARYLRKVRVKVPRDRRAKGRGPSSLQVPQTVAVQLARSFGATISPQLLRWAAQQATLLSPRKRAGQAQPDRAIFLSGLQEVWDYASNALVLKGDYPNYRAQKVELTRQSGSAALRNAKDYHALLGRVDNGNIRLSAQENPFEVGALLGISPGVLRDRNSGNALKHMLMGRAFSPLRLQEPKPLRHRHVFMRLPGGRAWVWVHPDDKGNLGAGYGWCVRDAPIWRNALQFAVVDKHNRPHALLTVEISGPNMGADKNAFIQTSPGRARVDFPALKRAMAQVYYSEIKGRYNARPPEAPYRQDVLRFIAKQPFGSLRVSKKDPAADWSAILTVQDDISTSRKNWKAAGGAPAVFSIVDKKGASQKHMVGSKTTVADWLQSPLAPLMISALPQETLAKIGTQLPAKLRAERARMTTTKWGSSDRLTGPERAALADALMARRAGARIPAGLVRNWRDRLNSIKKASSEMSAATARRIMNRWGAQSEKAVRLLVRSGAAGEAKDMLLAALYREYENPAPRYELMAPALKGAMRGINDQIAVAVTCELYTLGLALAPAGSRVATKTRAKIVDLAAREAAAVGNRTATVQDLEESGLERIEEEGMQDGGFFYTTDGAPITEEYPITIAWLRAEESDGSGAFHCLACAGFTTEPVGPEQLSCADFMGMFYPDTVDTWWQTGIGIDVGLLLAESALKPLDVTPLVYSAFDYGISDMPLESLEEILQNGPTDLQLNSSILDVLGGLNLGSFAADNFAEERGMAQRAAQFSQALAVHIQQNPTRSRLVRSLGRLLGKSRKELPLVAMAAVQQYQRKWDRA